MWSDNAHGEGFHHAHPFPHAPALDKLCLHSRLGCVLAGGIRGSAGGGSKGERGPSFLAQLQDPPSAPSATEISAEAAVFVAVIVVFYAAIIVILLGTNMRRPRSLSSRSRSRSRSRHRHEAVLDPESGSVVTKQTQKKKKKRDVDCNGERAENV